MIGRVKPLETEVASSETQDSGAEKQEFWGWGLQGFMPDNLTLCA